MHAKHYKVECKFQVSRFWFTRRHARTCYNFYFNIYLLILRGRDKQFWNSYCKIFTTKTKILNQCNLCKRLYINKNLNHFHNCSSAKIHVIWWIVEQEIIHLFISNNIWVQFIVWVQNEMCRKYHLSVLLNEWHPILITVSVHIVTPLHIIF